MTEIKKSPIDLASALERTGNDESFLFELIDLYIEDFPEKYNSLQDAIEQKNFEIIHETGHNLKGSSANLSLTSLQEVSCDIETAGKEKNIEKAKQSMSLLEQEFERLKNFLSKKEG